MNRLHVYSAMVCATLLLYVINAGLVLYSLWRFGQNLPAHVALVLLLLAATVFGGWRWRVVRAMQQACGALPVFRHWLLGECVLCAGALGVAVLIFSAATSRLFGEGLPLMD